MTTDFDSDMGQARAQVEAIVTLTKALEAARAEDPAPFTEEGIGELEMLGVNAEMHVDSYGVVDSWYDLTEAIEDAIREDVLSVEVRSGWVALGQELAASEYMLLLMTGGPAVRIVGEIGLYGEPDNGRVEFSGWGTPWTEYILDDDAQSAVRAFAQTFYFGS